jgi:AAA+ ATPase superfamily predicted ATPase
VTVLGRRRVGKSRLVEQFCEVAGEPAVVFQATKWRAPDLEQQSLVAAVASAGVGDPRLTAVAQPGDWLETLQWLAAVLPDDRVTIVVIDEVPWLSGQDAAFEGALQTAWDRHLSRKPVLLVLIGSDISVMTALVDYDRPFHGRTSVLRVEPLTVAEVGQMTGLAPADAVDSWLITGGFPDAVVAWEPGMGRQEYLAAAFGDPLSPLLAGGELTLLNEFPSSVQARAVLESIGSGERTFARIAGAGRRAPVPAGTLAPLLEMLETKGVVAKDLPLSTASDTKNSRYRVADPSLRFWLAFGARAVGFAQRGRADLGLAQVASSWTSWRGRAVEPLVRASLSRLLPNDMWPGVGEVGGWWNRANNPEVDLVGADREPVATSVLFLGLIKWRDDARFGARDVAQLAKAAGLVPGTLADTPLVGVSRAGFDEQLPLAAGWTPEDIVGAWA